MKLARYTFLFLLFSFKAVCGFSQQVTWAFNLGGSGIDVAQSGHVDMWGNVYTCGEFRGLNVDFDPSGASVLRSSNGAADGFVSKFSTDGQHLLTITIGGSGLDKIHSVATDQSGNIYVTGYFRGSNVDFDPSAATAYLSSNGDAGGDPGYGGDIFVAKYNAAGQYQWAFNIGGTTLGDAGIVINISPGGDVFVGGYFRETADFDPSPTVHTLSAVTGGTAFIAKYDATGQYQWAHNFGQPNVDNSVFDLEVDNNSVYFTGYFSGTNIDFDPSAASALLSSAGGFEIFLAKFSLAGQYQFAFKVGGLGTDVGRGLTLDNAGNIYLFGDFNGSSIDFDPSPAAALLSSNGASDVFVAKYTNAGQYVWAFNAGSTGGEIGWEISTDNASVFVTGGFSGIADFNPGAAVDNLTSNGGSDIFLAKYDVNGNYQCAFNIGSPGDDNGYDIMIAGNDRFYLTGTFRGSNVDFAPSQSSYLLNSAGSDDIFLVKYYWPPNVLPAGTVEGNTICKGGTGQLTFTATAGTSPFVIQYSDGVHTYNAMNVVSGIPFDLQVTPAVTTTYTITLIEDAVRCSPSSTSPLTATVIVDDAVIHTRADTILCANQPVHLTTNGAQTYSWSPDTYLSSAIIASPVATPAISMQYIVTGLSASGCTLKDTVNVNVYASPAITISNDTAICQNTSVQLFINGGLAYSWSPASTLDNASSSSPVATPTANTMYYVDIVDLNNCSSRDSVAVSIRPAAVFAISPPVNVCMQDSVRLNASGGDIYSWQPLTGLSNTVVADPWAFPVVPTTYTVTITESSCNESTTLTTTVTPLSLPVISASKSNDIDCIQDNSQLNATGAVNYSWQPATSLSNAGISAPVATPVSTTTYTVTGTDSNGCNNNDTVTVNVGLFNQGSFLMPTGFTPNNDGLNDCYGVKYWGVITDIDFSIYNRWGERVFHSTKPGACWDGRYKGMRQDAGVFVYVIKAKTTCEPVVFRKGTFALIR